MLHKTCLKKDASMSDPVHALGNGNPFKLTVHLRATTILKPPTALTQYVMSTVSGFIGQELSMDMG